MADRRHRLTGVEERLHKLDRLPPHPEFIGIDDAARQQDGVEIASLCLFEFQVDRKLIAPVLEVPTTNKFAFGRDDACLGASLVECFPRLDHLDLLKAVIDEDRDFQTFEILISHVFSPYLNAAAPASATAWSCSGEPPLTPMAPTTLPFRLSAMPP